MMQLVRARRETLMSEPWRNLRVDVVELNPAWVRKQVSCYGRTRKENLAVNQRSRQIRGGQRVRKRERSIKGVGYISRRLVSLATHKRCARRHSSDDCVFILPALDKSTATILKARARGLRACFSAALLLTRNLGYAPMQARTVPGGIAPAPRSRWPRSWDLRPLRGKIVTETAFAVVLHLRIDPWTT
ncbi:hypothetical protein BC628DRAFT_896989 [Trametes gibbosa]|nr:hypothetical protein BC628DRAFT_896989 [Trametes gibbosa]